MPLIDCPRCGEDYEIPDPSTRLITHHGVSGNLVAIGTEQVVHRCPTLSVEDETVLLADVGWIIDNPES